ncbi:uridine kinase [Streptomyces sp. MS19]|uniref:uridine kinase family protein n=1 Tax=Streptomyces sp. MS19 TaxID=3385972 RepID=UPI00399F4A58
MSDAAPPPPAGPLADVLARTRAAPPRLGRVRLVGIDGHAGSGKSTLARRLSAALDGAPVVHLDDLASHASFFGWAETLARDVLGPLERGGTARYRGYDWERGGFTRDLTCSAAPVVLLEGVGAGRRAVRPYLSLLVWMDVPAATAWARGRRRDGPGLADFWRAWEAAELRHFADDPSCPHADMLITPARTGEGWPPKESRAGRDG